MSEFWQGVLTAICTNGLLLALFGYWLNRDLQRHEKQLERINSVLQTRFHKYHVDSVDAICETYALFVEMHNSVFRYCLPDWGADDASDVERKRIASDKMVRFYEHFRKKQILMEDATISEFEKSFRFLQQIFLKKDVPGLCHNECVQVALAVYADITKTAPEMLGTLRREISNRIGPGAYHATNG